MGFRGSDELPRRGAWPTIAALTCLAALPALASLGASGALGFRPRAPATPSAPQEQQADPPRPQASIPVTPERFRVVSTRMEKKQTPMQALAALGLGAPDLQAVLGALRQTLSFRRVPPGVQIRLEQRQADGAFRSLSWRQTPTEEFLVRPCGQTLCATRREVELRREAVRVAVTVRSSLYDAIRDAGEDPGLAVAISDVLAWDVDLYQEARVGDTLKVIAERLRADGRFLRYGDVLAIEYEGQATGRKRLFRYTDPAGGTAYYDDEGQSAKRGFLRAPVPYVNVTSRFGSRLHPLLKYVRAHQGVDYGAPEGTPVWAVGDGVVSKAGAAGECGLSVSIRHRNGLETLYCHLSSISVAAGSRVVQKQVIGRVGKTGLATGAHLHFAVRRDGTFVNPSRLESPRGAPVRPEWRADFESKIKAAREQLDAVPLAWAGRRPAPPL